MTRHRALQVSMLAMLGSLTSASWAAHPNPQPRPGFSTQIVFPDGTVTVSTPQTLFPDGASNELAYTESNMFDRLGNEMINTLPSTPDVDFNLHDGPVLVSEIPKDSPTTDLSETLQSLLQGAEDGVVDPARIQFALDILEGSPIPDRRYSGFAVLHYTGPERIKRVQPIYDEQGNKVGGNVNVHQIWFDNHIESDAVLLDPTDVQDVPWTITYTVDVLKGGADDFSPFVCYYDAPPSPTSFVDTGAHGPPHIGMDATFYPMHNGHSYQIKVKHALGRYLNLVYTWGWRIHPMRVQAMENALKVAGPMRLTDWEISTFGANPRADESAKLAAIAKIGDLAPAKRMWTALRNAQGAPASQVAALMEDALEAFEDWTDRTRLPAGFEEDPSAEQTLVYVNNTLYGNIRKIDNWSEPGKVLVTKVINGDNFPHGYVAVDFGGLRGWENQFEDAGGPGASHTFGRAHFWPVAGGPNGPIVLAPGDERFVEIELNYAPSERISLYQFDPFHHDVAVYSLH